METKKISNPGVWVAKKTIVAVIIATFLIVVALVLGGCGAQSECWLTPSGPGITIRANIPATGSGIRVVDYLPFNLPVFVTQDGFFGPELIGMIPNGFPGYYLCVSNPLAYGSNVTVTLSTYFNGRWYGESRQFTFSNAPGWGESDHWDVRDLPGLTEAINATSYNGGFSQPQRMGPITRGTASILNLGK